MAEARQFNRSGIRAFDQSGCRGVKRGACPRFAQASCLLHGLPSVCPVPGWCQEPSLSYECSAPDMEMLRRPATATATKNSVPTDLPELASAPPEASALAACSAVWHCAEGHNQAISNPGLP